MGTFRGKEVKAKSEALEIIHGMMMGDKAYAYGEALRLFHDRYALADKVIPKMSLEELPLYLVHKDSNIRQLAKKRIGKLGRLGGFRV
jgi:hypothetical protein